MIVMQKLINKKMTLFISLLLVFAMCISGCGKKQEDVPELLEPKITNSSYRPVSYGDIGKKVIKTAYVLPTNYCYFYNSSVEVTNIYVNIGQYVEAGTVLADANSEAIEEELSDIENDIANQRAIHDINQKIFKESQAELDWKIKACEEFGDKKGAEEYKIQKETEAENNRYDNLLFNYQIKKTQQKLDDKNDLSENGTLKADKSGYVTYIKNLSEGGEVSGGENVVVISDANLPYIEITGEAVAKGAYDLFTNMYTMIDGKKYDIELFEYSNKEMATAQSMSSIPDVRFKLKENNDKLLKVGTTLSLYFTTSEIMNVLVIGNDSLYEENGQKFVYVKTDSNDKERRDIVAGESDLNYTQVIDGLKEGELVYYMSDSIMPANYVEYDITLSNLNVTGSTKNIEMEDRNLIVYKAPCEGYFTKFELEEGQEVKKGDLLFSIDSGGGSAAVKEIDMQIAAENSSYNSIIADYDSQIKSLSKQIKDWKSGKLPKKKATPSDAGEENTLYMAEQLTCEKQIVTYNKQIAVLEHNATISSLNKQREKLNKNNDGSGIISVYAEQDGIVKKASVSTDVMIEEGSDVVSVGSDKDFIMSTNLYNSQNEPGGKLMLNQTVTLVNNTDETDKISGRCIGLSYSSRVFVNTDAEGNVHITKCAGDSVEKYYIEVEDETFYEHPKAYYIKYAKESLQNVIAIPANMIYHEKEKNSNREFDFVWKLVDGQLVKQYVTLGAEDQSQKTILTGLYEGDVIVKEVAE